MALKERLVSVVKKIIRNAAEIGLDEAGYRLLGSGWVFLKKALTPVLGELENKLAPKTLQSWNILVVCPLCHKKLHYADVTTEFLDPGWRLVIEGIEYLIS